MEDDRSCVDREIRSHDDHGRALRQITHHTRRIQATELHVDAQRRKISLELGLIQQGLGLGMGTKR
ncbi:hypothetical protein RPE78_13190 [Thioclava litoralis]|uniref:Uncharacterized protein n=1 Tax=Thioclava litoralis TaxID=3076557 RepID=A0ABZ1DYR6_9RHOB|nr:hypothetical protein RPE78_13190 [Thioclava sp. FTW29]